MELEKESVREKMMSFISQRKSEINGMEWNGTEGKFVLFRGGSHFKATSVNACHVVLTTFYLPVPSLI